MSRTETTPVALQRLAGRIEEWRRTRSGRMAMPEELWTAAARLAARHGVSRVCGALGIGWAGLSRRVAESHAARSSPEPVGFVELRGDEILGAHASCEAVIEVTDGTGARLTVRPGAGATLDVAAIVAAFRRGGA